jgi:hypothetical protein
MFVVVVGPHLTTCAVLPSRATSFPGQWICADPNNKVKGTCAAQNERWNFVNRTLGSGGGGHSIVSGWSGSCLKVGNGTGDEGVTASCDDVDTAWTITPHVGTTVGATARPAEPTGNIHTDIRTTHAASAASVVTIASVASKNTLCMAAAKTAPAAVEDAGQGASWHGFDDAGVRAHAAAAAFPLAADNDMSPSYRTACVTFFFFFFWTQCF